MLGQGAAKQGSAVAQRLVLTDNLPEHGPVVRQGRKPGRRAMFAVGFLLLALFIASLVIGRLYGNATTKHEGGESQTTEKSSSKTVKSTGEAKAGVAAADSTSTEESKKTTYGSAPPKREWSTEVTKNLPSEGVLLALLGAGVVLVLCGGLYSRLTTIKVLGAELDLSGEPSKEESDKLQDAVVQKAKAKEPDGPDPKKVAEATVVSYAVARAHKQATGRELSNEIIQLAADIGVKAAGFS
jgi:hypothetical protein